MIRTTRDAWNRAVDTVPGWPQQRLEPVPPKWTPYWLREDQLPAALREQITAYLASLAQPDPFLGPSRKALAPGTVDQHRIVCITLASALVALRRPGRAARPRWRRWCSPTTSSGRSASSIAGPVTG